MITVNQNIGTQKECLTEGGGQPNFNAWILHSHPSKELNQLKVLERSVEKMQITYYELVL